MNIFQSFNTIQKPIYSYNSRQFRIYKIKKIVSGRNKNSIINKKNRRK
jgi:hypothetical protein